MKMQFLGTGAADFDWTHYGEPGTLGSTVTLINDSILLDCGPTAAAAMERFSVNCDQIRAVVNTHSHSDHFQIDQLRKISGGRRIPFYGSAETCEKVADFCEVHPLEYGDEFEIDGVVFQALPSNHSVGDLHEKTYNYLISGDRVLLYALDTSWLTAHAWTMLGTRHIDAVVWDATMSQPGDWRVFTHSDPEMFTIIRQTLERRGNFDSSLKVWFDHRAKTLWPESVAEQEAVAARYDAMLAHDGETVFI